MLEGPASGVPNPRQLTEHARGLAGSHRKRTSVHKRARSLLPLVHQAAQGLTRGYDELARAALDGDAVSPGSQWILDNFYVVREQVRDVLRHTGGRFYRELPRLDAGRGEGLPRVFDIVSALAWRVDNAVDTDNLSLFVNAYQDVEPLTLGELWAIPTTLRIVLLRNLHGLVERVQEAQRERLRAGRWASRIIEEGGDDPTEGLILARAMFEEEAPLQDEFVVTLFEHLKNAGAAAEPVLEWLDRRLEARQPTLRAVARQETQRQVSVGNAITTLRWISDARWGPFVEQVSLTERSLQADPADVYPRMDFTTRDRYRHVVEDLARYSPLNEVQVADRVVECSRESAPDDEARHVGYHLIGPGAHTFERLVEYRPPLRLRARRFVYRHPALFYLGTVALLLLLAETLTVSFAVRRGLSLGLQVLVGVTAFLPLLDVAVSFANRIVADLVPPRPLPKMSRKTGLTRHDRALVAVPTLISSPADARRQVEQLQIRALANPHPQLRFALLTDFPDASRANTETDQAILDAATAAVRELNDRWADEWGDRFFLLHRERRWNAAEGVWMGWERKRGKLEELNTLLREPDTPTSFTTFEGDFFGVTANDSITYVITLDADTQLPPGVAVDLVRTASHPLNRPRYDPERRRVTRGYGILQPRVSIAARGISRSPFARIFSGHVGIDPYTTAVSDVYQDLFREGIYTGKGLYDVTAFRASLHGIVPTNRVLSHDLLESNFARAALVTDVELFDDYPSSYITFAKRQHRWVRGDWQISPWLFPWVRDAAGILRRNPVSVLSRWQIVDNLRRSLNGPAMLLFLLAGWVALPRSPHLWTAIALAVLAAPIYLSLTTAVFARPRHATWRSWLRHTFSELWTLTAQTTLWTIFLAHQSLYALDAIGRALWRMLVSRKRLLQWTTASALEARTSNTLGAYWRFMWPSAAWGVGAALLVVAFQPEAAVVALPFMAIWTAAPWVAWLISRRPPPERVELTAAQHEDLRELARRTWSWFERFATPERGWLAPDNFQERPYRGVAERTSPTNIGLGLLCTQTAHDFGYLCRSGLLERVEGAAESIDRLEKHRGHLFNWVHTLTGETLWPRYVSTVDSGNLALSLLALEQGLRKAATEPWPGTAVWSGIADSRRLVSNLLDSRGWVDADQSGVAAALDDLDRMGRGPYPTDLVDVHGRMREALHAASRVAAGLGAIEAAGDGEMARQVSTAGFVARQLRDSLTTRLTEMEELVPGLADGTPLETADRASTLQELAAALATAERAARPSDDTRAVSTALSAARHLLGRHERMADWCHRTAWAMDFRMLYDSRRHLFAIGYDAERLQQDPGHYDLLASEARTASYFAIAKGDVPPEHWFRLGRVPASLDGRSALLSWGGTLFEYLMPHLFMPSWQGTLLDETYTNAVSWQMQYGQRMDLPWGVSESAYNLLNVELDYQYRAFGVPGLGLKRGLSEDYVVAPYASVLALMVRPNAAARNLETLRSEGAYGRYGFYDAVDYTRSRLQPGETHQVVMNYMAHHQAMSLLALANVLEDLRVQRLFHASAPAQSVELLLQERIPRRLDVIEPHPMETSMDPGVSPREAPPVEYVARERLADPAPLGQLLSNGRYTTLVTQAGSGFSRFNDYDVTRWSPDRTRDRQGFYIYVRDLESGRLWSATHQPVCADSDRLDVWFHLNKVESALVHDWIETFVEVCVSPEDDVEVRRVTITNYSDRIRHLDLTSYVEVALNRLGADRAHPAFSKLFVQTEFLPGRRALLARRRPRQHGERLPWVFHALADGLDLDAMRPPPEYETDRMRFVGRGRTLANPEALDPGVRLSQTTGSVIDPVLSLRRTIVLEPRQKAVVSFALGTAETRPEAELLADRYDNPPAVQRAIELATVYGSVENQHLDITGEQALEYQTLASAILYGHPGLRAKAKVIRRNRKQQAGLWAYGISGDRPIVVARAASVEELEFVHTVVKAFQFWRLKGLDVDLVCLNDHPPSYAEQLHDEIERAASGGRNGGGGIFVLRTDQIPKEDVTLILSVASAVLRERVPDFPLSTPDLEPEADDHYSGAVPATSGPGAGERAAKAPFAEPELRFDNGWGGFAPDGSYHIRTRVGPDGAVDHTPLPWSNVIANARFGFLATEAGGGNTWSLNSRENRLTEWSNDPVRDPPSEALYIRDEDEGIYWSASPSPTPAPDATYHTIHGFGHTTYRGCHRDLAHEIRLSAAREKPIKFIRVRLENLGDRPKRVSVFRYQGWVLGVLRELSSRTVVTWRDTETGALFAQNHYNQEFAGRVAFSQVVAPEECVTDFTTDREAFLGRNGGVSRPRAVGSDPRLDGRTGAGLDPCAAHRVELQLDSGQSAEFYFVVGEGATEDEARSLVRTVASVPGAESVAREGIDTWTDFVDRIRVESPSDALDVLLNGWLPYQNLACRVWGRTAFYQSGGAFGFRDQLQDAMALVYTRPELARQQIVEHSARQFPEGDVLHWWHPPTGRGIRSRFSDDLLWLPYVTAFYIGATGDDSVLDVETPFLDARPLEPGEDEAYLVPTTSDDAATVYEHCCRTLDRSLTRGQHGLPLMGSGDWNDGMNRVGHGGQGESVWLAFFLNTVLRGFLPLCEARGDDGRLARYTEYLDHLKRAVDTAAWDGAWYRRAYYDDGTPLGSRENDECRIDAIAQAWSVISGMASPHRAQMALASVEEHLVDEEAGIIRLLDPPFDRTPHDPGYIKGYIPGVRENGGQYTHGALWVIRAFAEMDMPDRAMELFSLVNPVNHALDRAAAERYKVEPYVATADIYGVAPHEGRGGWSWYTGSAGWMYRVALESILGFTLEGGSTIRLEPRIPADWPGFAITYRPDGETVYRIEVENDAPGVELETLAELDGGALEVVDGVVRVPLERDGGTHTVRVTLRTAQPAEESHAAR